MFEDRRMNWKAGDTAIFIANNAKDDIAGVSGATVILLKFVGRHNDVYNAWHVQLVDKISVRGKTECCVDEKALRKPYDGNELCEWKDCIFQPKELVVTT